MTPPLTFPAPLGKLLSLLPHYPHSFLFAQGLNLALRPMLGDDKLEPLRDRRYCIRVRDAGLEFHFTVTPQGFAASYTRAAPDLTISATAADFILLATRREDPDTLFFSRRLLLEGDTELGLLVKNTLDTLELPFAELSDLSPARLAHSLKSRLPPPFLR